MDLRLGRWEEVLAGETCDSVIVDPPYGARTHAGHDHAVRDGRQYDAAKRRALVYEHWTPQNVHSFVTHWSDQTRGWLAILSCSDLVPVYKQAFERCGRVSFAPVPCIIRGMTVRLAGDGPSNWAIYLNVARPRNREYSRWGTLPGSYIVTRGADFIGGKPLSLMSAIVRDYTRPGELVCDPCAGLATTAIAAVSLERRFIGSEVDPATHAVAQRRIAAGIQQDMFA